MKQNSTQDSKSLVESLLEVPGNLRFQIRFHSNRNIAKYTKLI